MKKKLLWISALLIATGVHAQTEVTTGVMRGKEYGVTYLLPKTEIEIVLQITKHTYTPGEFCKYADRYLRLGNVSAEPEAYWTLDKIQPRIAGIPDKDNVYFVKLKDKTVAPLMELTEDGIVRSINMPLSGQKPDKAVKTIGSPENSIDPRSFLTEEILMSNSSAKMAELVAKEIYNIRESKNALLRGEADNMPKDGTQLKLMLDNLNLQELAMTEMFSGTVKSESGTFTIRITPKEMKDEIAFRFSKKLGIVANNDFAGEPYYISITDLKTPDTSGTEESKKKTEGIAYNVPGRAKVTLVQKNKKLFEEEFPITQFGIIEYLAPVLFNKNSTIKVLFDTATGGLIKVDRE
ncbi:DUF4831 family protein [Bacteroides helcogenes]|uniref:DUF4831 domain-containing protein n=1 Tax=Bacteroides helcogenes (strain ATCC 35417 / DSM 20613 / JCM 6297 / CCUG 15421 / P 36-108) TaxID=693979 RepID=E6SW77_BACT6|nr:DUF4831 family protein [Bacteroides helcogenes]ADV43552.1 hypothetical protein Bache_1547 [Bacteroides helcogenes P 36-108]MDY5239275.1 DUF4831 family protein [Bacteroides helcogenes]